MRPSDIAPEVLRKELLRLYRLDPEWLVWKRLEGNRYEYMPKQPTWVRRLWKSGADAAGMKALSVWLGQGPKVFKPTKEQCKALEHVDVNLTIEEYCQPYPAILVVVDYPPFHGCLCYVDLGMITCALYSKENENDICTTIGNLDGLIEQSLQRFNEDCQDLSGIAVKALRVACNSCLALSHYGNHLDYLFPKEVENDKRLAREPSERGKRAKQRLPLAVQVISFDQEVIIHKVQCSRTHKGNPTGKEVSPHWRRGHWHTVLYGEKKTLRKRVLFPPILVRPDLFVGDLANTQTTYEGG